jgi:hypothetical protein
MEYPLPGLQYRHIDHDTGRIEAISLVFFLMVQEVAI